MIIYKLMIIIFVILFISYSSIDAFIIQPGTRPDYCDDCIIPASTEEAQGTSMLEMILITVLEAANRIVKRKS